MEPGETAPGRDPLFWSTGTTSPHPFNRDAPSPAAVRWLCAIYLCSGFCSLVDEVVWVRLIKLTLGNTVYASSIVVSVFMGGLALGALVMARYADRVERRLRLYAILECLAALSALALPFALRLADRGYRWFYAAFTPSAAAVTAVQVLVSAALLLAPTFVMGSTLPLLGRYVTALSERTGGRVGRLYALNMLGAGAGCFLAGFVLIREVGVMGALYIAAAANLLVAIAGWLLSRYHDRPATGTLPEPSPPPAGADPPAAPDAAGADAGRGRRLFLLLGSGFFASGLISIGYELIWMRSIVFLLGNFTYVFSAVLTVYLAGNVAGAWIGSRLARRGIDGGAAFGAVLSILGALGVLYLPWLRFWHAVGGPLRHAPFLGIFAPLLFSFVLFFLPSLVMGIGFPLALQAWSRYLRQVGKTTGDVYGINTIGAVLGGVLAGFVLIPLLGVQYSISLLGLAGCLLGAALFHAAAEGGLRPYRAAPWIAAVAAALIAVLLPSDLYTRWFLGFKNYRFVEAREGITTTVTVYEGPEGAKVLATSGVVVAGSGREIRSAQKTLGHLGVLLDRAPREVLSIGFGSGETTKCLSMHELKRIDCVEIAPELVDAALRHFRDINLGDDLERSVNVHYMDGKNFLHVTNRRYDVIINGADVPYMPGSAPMFGKEHFACARDHLKPGGYFITKMHLNNVTRSSFDSILGTFLEVFPHASIWFPVTKPYFFFYLAGSNEPQRFSIAHIEAELARPEAKESFRFMNLRNSHDVLTWYMGDERDMGRYLGPFHENSDLHPYVEFHLDEPEMHGLDFFLEFVKKVRSRSIFDHLDGAGLSPGGSAAWRRDHEAYLQGAERMILAHGETHFWHKLRLVYEGLTFLPDHPALREKEDAVLAEVGDALGRGTLPPQGLLADMDTLLQGREKFDAPWLIKSWAFQKEKATGAALSAARKAVEYGPENPRALDNLAVLLLKTGEMEKALSLLQQAVALAPRIPSFRHHLAAAYGRMDRLEEAAAALEEVLRLRPRDARARCDLGDVYLRLGRRDEAAAQFRRVLQANPGHRRARMALKRMKAL